jgi:hypothetical protein
MPPIHFKRSEEVRNGNWKLRITNFELRMRSSAFFNLRLSTWTYLFFSRRSTLIFFSQIHADLFSAPICDFNLRLSAWTIFLIFFSRRSTLIYFLLIYADFFSASICVFNLRTSAWNNLWNILPLNFMDILHSFVGLRCAAAPDCVITFSFSTNIIAAMQLHPSIVF